MKERKLATWISGERTFQVEGTARVKAQRQESVWYRGVGGWSEWGREAMGSQRGPGGPL